MHMMPDERTASLFAGDQHAATYAAHRPSYPAQLYDAIWQFGGLDQSPKTLALDVATGSGQCAAELANSFQHVVATDVAAAQLQHAAARPNVTYHQASAEDLAGVVDDASVDLATAAQALHWFDLEKFYLEMRRVLKPTGVLAVWGYGMLSLAAVQGAPPTADLPTADAALQELYASTLSPYWDQRRGLVELQYRGMEPGARHFGVVQRAELALERDMTLDQLAGYVQSWSAYQKCVKEHPEPRDDPLSPFLQRLKAALGISEGAGAGVVLRTTAPLFLIMAKAPVPLPA